VSCWISVISDVRTLHSDEGLEVEVQRIFFCHATAYSLVVAGDRLFHRAANHTQLLVYVLLQLIRDIGGAAIVAAATTIWLKIWTTLASKGRVDSKVSRKVIHCG
jgi:hypothetical protein